MSSVQPAKSGPNRDASLPPSIPIGVRTHAVVSGRWVAVALSAALGLTALVFFLLPAWLSPPDNTQLPPVVVSKPAPPAAPRTTDPAETVRQRLGAEEAASRYREKSQALAQQGAAMWASEDWAAATARGDEAATAVVARDYARAIKIYDDASRQLTAIAGQAAAA